MKDASQGDITKPQTPFISSVKDTMGIEFKQQEMLSSLSNAQMGDNDPIEHKDLAGQRLRSDVELAQER